MSEIRVKVVLNDGKSPANLISAFFKDFNPQNQIGIKESQAKLKIVFGEEKLPTQLIEAITSYHILEFVCGEEVVDDKKETDSKAEVSKPEKLETIVPKKSEEKKTEESSETISDASEMEAKGEMSQAISFCKPERIVQKAEKESEKSLTELLEELWAKATDFEQFLDLLVERLKVEGKATYFKLLCIASTEVEKLIWRNLDENIQEKGTSPSVCYRQWIAARISEHLKIKIMMFLTGFREFAETHKLLARKENQPIQQVLKENKAVQQTPEEDKAVQQAPEEDKVVQQTPEEDKAVQQAPEEDKVVQQIPKEEQTKEEEKTLKDFMKTIHGIRLACMPENKELEEALESMTRITKLSLEEKICFILVLLDGKTLSQTQKNAIVKLIETALQESKIDLKLICVEEEFRTTQRLLSRLLDNFAARNGGEKVKLETFLTQLQAVIVQK